MMHNDLGSLSSALEEKHGNQRVGSSITFSRARQHLSAAARPNHKLNIKRISRWGCIRNMQVRLVSEQVRKSSTNQPTKFASSCLLYSASDRILSGATCVGPLGSGTECPVQCCPKTCCRRVFLLDRMSRADMSMLRSKPPCSPHQKLSAAVAPV